MDDDERAQAEDQLVEIGLASLAAVEVPAVIPTLEPAGGTDA